VESLNYATANFYAMVLFAVCFSILLTVYVFNKKMLRAI
jgi:molybdate transport system permease protein